MKKAIFSLVLLVSLTAVCQNTQLLDTTMQRAIYPGGYTDTKIDFKPFSAETRDGKIFTSDNLKGKVTFINFWFESCAPCVAEFDALNALYAKYKDNKDFQFISFTYESNETIARITRKYHLNYPIVHVDQDKIYGLIFQLGFPTNIVTDPSGKISFIKSGGPIDKEIAQKEFNKIYASQVERLLFPQ